MRAGLDQVATAILLQSPIDPPPQASGNRALLAQVSPHKSLFYAPHGTGLPIGNLTGQFFANVYFNALDQFIKHTRKVRACLREVCLQGLHRCSAADGGDGCHQLRTLAYWDIKFPPIWMNRQLNVTDRLHTPR